MILPASVVSMIPGAFEPNAPPHRAGRVPAMVPTLALVRPSLVTDDQAAYVVSASPRPTTWIGQSAVMLRDLVIAMGLVLAAVVVPVLLARAIAEVGALLTGR